MPYPSTDGESIVILNDLKMLKSLGHSVGLYCLNTNKHKVDTHSYEDILLWDNFYTYDIDTNSIKTLLKAAISPKPFQIARFYSEAVDQELSRIVRQNKIDLIFYQGLAMTQYQSNTEFKKLYRVHNLEYKVWISLANHTNNVAKKLMCYWMSKSLLKYETKELSGLSCAVTLCDSEEVQLKHWYSDLKTRTIPIAIESKKNLNYSSSKEGMLFIGSLDWQPNREGLNWFLKYIYPSISHIPMTIAGKGEFQCNLKNVTIISNYESTEELLASHRLLIVPLLSGAGIRIKILEAMKFGLPFISTTIGADGIRHENCGLIYDYSEDWIYKLGDIYEDKMTLNEISKTLKHNYQSHYSDDAIGHDWFDLMNSI